MNTPGERIRYLRQLVDMSQEELGRRVGVQRAAINKYEKGSVTNIPITTIERIAKVLEVTPCYLVGWNGEDYNPLAKEYRLLQYLKKIYGKDVVHLLEKYVPLNDQGRKRVHQYVEDMSQIYSAESEDV